jgi:hypothetical protein
MNESHHYRIVAIWADGQRKVLAKRLAKDFAESLASKMQVQELSHQVLAECEPCFGSEAAAPAEPDVP